MELRELGFCFRSSGSLSGEEPGPGSNWKNRSGCGAGVRGQVGAWQLDPHAVGRIVSPPPKIW